MEKLTSERGKTLDKFPVLGYLIDAVKVTLYGGLQVIYEYVSVKSCLSADS